MEKGYIKLYRAIDDNELLANDNTCFVVFLKLLTHANRLNGTYTTGRFKLASLCNLNPNTLYSALKRLEASTMIQQQSNRTSTSITICNWAMYQQDINNTSTIRQTNVNTKQEREREREINNTMSTSVDDSVLFYELVEILGFDKSRTKFLDERKRKLKQRLKMFDAQTIKQAAKALSDSPYHQGENPDGRRYGNIDFLIRADSQVEKWANEDIKQSRGKRDF